MTHFLGAHTIDNGGIDMAARRAASAGMKALQIFTAIPKYYGDRVSIRPERVARFRTALAETSNEPGHVVAHAAYVLNTATPEADKWTRARDGLTRRLRLGGHVHHARVTTGGQMRKAAEAVVADGLPRPCESLTRQALTPGRACRMIDSIRSFAISFSFLSSLIRHCWSVESGAVPRNVSSSRS